MTNTPPAGVSSQQRHRKSHPCLICGGYEEMSPGQGTRCYGYLGADGEYEHCTREQFAGSLPMEDGATFAHKLKGECKCGVEHAPAPPRPAQPRNGWTLGEPVVIYTYVDSDGVEWEKGRFEPPGEKKQFLWRRKGETRWSGGAKMATMRLYGYDEIAEFQDEEVWLVEGEKARQALVNQGYLAVCTAGGAKFKDIGFALQDLRDRVVRIWPDKDNDGEFFALNAAALLRGIAKTVILFRWAEALDKDDAFDFFARGNTREDLDRLIQGDASPEEQEERTAPYSFEPSVTCSFVLDYIRYREMTSDAALEYAEAMAVGMLATMAGNALKVPLMQEPKPVPTSLYILLLGDSTVSRKTNSLRNAEAMIEDVWPDVVMESPGSPEALVQGLSVQQQGALWTIDEVAPWFRGIKTKPYQAELRGILLKAADNTPLVRRLRTKKVKGQEVQDADIARDPCLTILATATPDRLQEVSSQDDIADGFWPRWSFVWPQSRPPFRPMGPVSSEAATLRNHLLERLHYFRERLGGGVMAQLTEEAWDEANRQQQALQMKSLLAQDGLSAVYSRAEIRIFKVAALLAAFDDINGIGTVKVHDFHIEEAARLVNRWLDNAMRFAEQLGLNAFVGNLNKAERGIMVLKQALRRDVMRRLPRSVTSRDMDEIERTLVDRGAIEIIEGARSDSKVWHYIGGQA